MPRRPRIATGGLVYHALNRSVRRMTLFRDDADYDAFLRVLAEAVERRPAARLLGYCVMPNHWHLVLHPRGDDDLSQFMRWLTVTHTQRHHAHRRTAGTGPLYQGRFKSFPVKTDHHALTVLRYVERNALQAGLVDRAEDWRWGSLWRWVNRRTAAANAPELPELADWPVDRPHRWPHLVNTPLHDAEAHALGRSIQRGAPFGPDAWTRRTAQRLALEPTLRPPGRPKAKPNDIAP